MFLATGAVGYILGRHTRFVAGTAWADGVIWSQVAAGLVAAAFAVFFWRQAFRSVRSH